LDERCAVIGGSEEVFEGKFGEKTDYPKSESIEERQWRSRE
jgi:hypothetical protein